MKYLKTYEVMKIWSEYHKSDYVLLDTYKISEGRNFYEKSFNVYKNYGIITSNPTIGQLDRKLKRMYDISYIDDEEYIKRKLTPDEIEDFNQAQNQFKYNL